MCALPPTGRGDARDNLLKRTRCQLRGQLERPAANRESEFSCRRQIHLADLARQAYRATQWRLRRKARRHSVLLDQHPTRQALVAFESSLCRTIDIAVSHHQVIDRPDIDAAGKPITRHCEKGAGMVVVDQRVVHKI